MQGTAHHFTDVVHNEFGNYNVTARANIDGSYGISVMQGPTPIHELCYTTNDRALADLIHTTIKNGALDGHKSEQIAEAVRLELVFTLRDALNDRQPAAGKRVEEINRVLERAETPDDKARLAELQDHFNKMRGTGHVQQLPPLKRIPTQTPPPQLECLAHAVEHGEVERGGKPGQWPLPVLKAMARPEKRWLILVRKHGRVVAGIPTDAGKRYLRQHTAAMQATKAGA